MIRLILALMLFAAAPLAHTQPTPQHPHDQAREDRAAQREGWNRHDNIPRWCRHFSQRDYWREMRACGDDRRCRWDVRRKGERCGLR